MGGFDKVLQFFSNSFQSLGDQIKDFVWQQLQELGGDALGHLENPVKLYDQLQIESVVLQLVKSWDRNPKDDHLDVVPWVPEWIEEKAVVTLTRRIFLASCIKLKKELKAKLELQENGGQPD